MAKRSITGGTTSTVEKNKRSKFARKLDALLDEPRDEVHEQFCAEHPGSETERSAFKNISSGSYSGVEPNDGIGSESVCICISIII